MPTLDDQTGHHVPNYIPPRWFEAARRPLWQQVNALSRSSVQFGIVRHASYDYQRELFITSEITITTSIKSISNSSAICHQEAWQAGQLAIVATVVMTATDIESRGKATLEDAERQYLQTLIKS